MKPTVMCIQDLEIGLVMDLSFPKDKISINSDKVESCFMRPVGWLIPKRYVTIFLSSFGRSLGCQKTRA